MSLAETLRHFLHRHQELIAGSILEKKQARGSAAGFFFFAAPRKQPFFKIWSLNS